MLDKIKKFAKENTAGLIVGVIIGMAVMAILATGAPDIDYTPLGGDLVENELSVE